MPEVDGTPRSARGPAARWTAPRLDRLPGRDDVMTSNGVQADAGENSEFYS